MDSSYLPAYGWSSNYTDRHERGERIDAVDANATMTWKPAYAVISHRKMARGRQNQVTNFLSAFQPGRVTR